MNTISVSTRAVGGYVAERSFYKSQPVVKAAPAVRLWQLSVQKDRGLGRLEDACMAVLSVGGLCALGYGLSLVGVLSVRWAEIENTLNALIR